MDRIDVRSPHIRWISVDPGETVGWATWVNGKLEATGQTPMWEFAEGAATSTFTPGGDQGPPFDPDDESPYGELSGIVCEDFRLYPSKLKELEWDSVRTARVIGALELTARLGRIPFILQGALIKERAEMAGAEQLFVYPLHENRHANDAIRHGIYYLATQTPGFGRPVRGN